MHIGGQPLTSVRYQIILNSGHDAEKGWSTDSQHPRSRSLVVAAHVGFAKPNLQTQQHIFGVDQLVKRGEAT